MSKIAAIAINTFKEAVRNRVLYVLLFFAVLILLGAWVASSLAIFGQEKIVRDLGVAAINIISVLIAVFVGLGLVYNDLDKKTIYTIVSKPISRWQFLVGKYFGLLLTIYVNILIMTFFFIGVLIFRDYTSETYMNEVVHRGPDGGFAFASGGTVLLHQIKSLFLAIVESVVTVVSFGAVAKPVTAGIMQSSLLTMVEMSVITAFAVLFSCFTAPTLSAFMTVLVFLIGRANEDLYFYADLIARRSPEGVAGLTGGNFITYWFSMATAHIAPNLAVFDQREQIAQMLPPEISFYSIAYGVAYTAAVLVVAAMVFNNRNFK